MELESYTKGSFNPDDITVPFVPLRICLKYVSQRWEFLIAVVPLPLALGGVDDNSLSVVNFKFTESNHAYPTTMILAQDLVYRQ